MDLSCEHLPLSARPVYNSTFIFPILFSCRIVIKMADKYAPQDRKFCKFCNCWFANNKISIDNHERGASHQSNVEKEISKTRNERQDLAAAEQAMMQAMQRIEAKALRSFEDDAKRDPFARDEMERLRVSRS